MLNYRDYLSAVAKESAKKVKKKEDEANCYKKLAEKYEQLLKEYEVPISFAENEPIDSYLAISTPKENKILDNIRLTKL